MDGYSLRELLDIYQGWKGNRGDPDARDRARELCNRAYLSIWMHHAFNDHRLPTPVQITTVANQRTYALPPYFGRIPNRVTIIRNVTTGAKLAVQALDALQEGYPDQGTDLETATDPRIAAIAGPVGVTTQPSSAGQALEIISNHALDTDIRVLVEGLN